MDLQQPAKQATLDHLKQIYDNIIDYYVKMSGLHKFWDGYDYQPICWIDDPGIFLTNQGTTDREAAETFKVLISNQAMTVEVKGSSIKFRSRVVIITNNYTPIDLIGSVDPKDQGPIRESPTYRSDKPSI